MFHNNTFGFTRDDTTPTHLGSGSEEWISAEPSTDMSTPFQECTRSDSQSWISQATFSENIPQQEMLPRTDEASYGENLPWELESPEHYSFDTWQGRTDDREAPFQQIILGGVDFANRNASSAVLPEISSNTSNLCPSSSSAITLSDTLGYRSPLTFSNAYEDYGMAISSMESSITQLPQSDQIPVPTPINAPIIRTVYEPTTDLRNLPTPTVCWAQNPGSGEDNSTVAIQCSARSLKEPTAEDWDRLRAIVHSLYSRLSLIQIKDIIRDTYGFKIRRVRASQFGRDD